MVQNDGSSGPEQRRIRTVVRAAPEGLGLQSILRDFDLAVGDLWIQHHVRSGKNSRLQNVGIGESE